MKDLEIDALQRFHAQVDALTATGLPVELGLGKGQKGLTEELDEVSYRLSDAVSKGVTLERAVAVDARISTQYRTAFKAWTKCSGSLQALNVLTAPAAARARTSGIARLSSIQPMILIVLFYFAVAYLCVLFVPRIEALNMQFGRTPGLMVAVLQVTRDWMWVWLCAVPVAAGLILIIWGKRRNSNPYYMLASVRNYMSATDNAAYAERVVGLLESRVSLDDAIETAGLLPQEKLSVDSHGSNLDLPPLLAWACSKHSQQDSQAERFQFVAQVYHRIAQYRAKRIQSWLPPIVTAFLGGVLVLVIGLSVFLPIINLLLFMA